MLVDRGENKGYVIQADKVWFGNHIPGHLGIVLIEGDTLFHGAIAPSVPRPPHFRGFMITLRHTTLGRTPLDEWPTRRRTATFTTHNTHKRQTSMPSAGFEPVIPASERPQTHALDRAATGIGTADEDANMNNSRGRKRIYPSTGLWATCFSRGRKRIWFWSLRVTVDENWYPQIASPSPNTQPRGPVSVFMTPGDRVTQLCPQALSNSGAPLPVRTIIVSPWGASNIMRVIKSKRMR
jgi:hypothetical protein